MKLTKVTKNCRKLRQSMWWPDCLKGTPVPGILSLVGGFLLHLTLGTLYCFGNMNTYMTSYLRKHVPSQAHIQYSDAIWIPTLATFGQGLFMTLAGHLEERIGVKMTILLGSTFMTSGVFLTYFTIQHSIALTTLTYGFMFGFGTALAYAPPMGVAMRWFPRKKGLVNGIIVGGFGMGAFIFNQVQTVYLNPWNHELDKDGYFSNDEVLERVPSVFLLLGTIYGMMQLVAVLLITSPNEDDLASNIPLVTHAVDDEEVLYQSTGNINEAGVSSPSINNINLNPPESENLKPSQIVKTKEFWILWGTFVLNTQAIGYINSMYKAFGQTFINDDHFLAVTGAFAAVFNCVGRVFWGHFCDVFGYKLCMLIVTGAISLLYSTLYFTEFGQKATFAIWIWAIFFAFCGTFVLLPTASAMCFGSKYHSKNYGLVMTGSAAAAPIIAILTQVLSPRVGFLGMFIIIAIFSAISGGITLFFPSCPSPKNILERLNRSPTNI